MSEESTVQTIAGVLGNCLEWYDFALFGFFSDIIAETFFPPNQTGNDALLQSFAVFGGAFLMRPIGGLTIGYWGDKHGRKSALTLSLFLMGLPTFAMGCLPTYETAGGLSIFLLVLCRLLQGLSVGGQLPASLVYTVEKRPKERWGLYGSLVMMAACVGSMLGNLVGAAMRSALTDDQLRSFGWRIPFLSGILIIFVALYLHLHGVEHHPNAGVYDHQDSEIKNPVRASFKRANLMAIVACALTPMLWAAGYYVTFVWMAIFMHELIDNPVKDAFWVNFASSLFGLTLFLPIWATLSDKIGRTKTMATGAILTGCLGPAMVYVISSGNQAKAFFAQWFLGVLIALYGSAMCAWLVENFPQEVRLTSASLGYDIAHATAAGFSPLLATVMVDRKGPTSAGAIYPIFALLSLTGLFLMWRERRTGIEETGGAGDDDKDVPGFECGVDVSSVTDDPEGKPGQHQKETELVDGAKDVDEPGSNLNPIT